MRAVRCPWPKPALLHSMALAMWLSRSPHGIRRNLPHLREQPLHGRAQDAAARVIRDDHQSRQRSIYSRQGDGSGAIHCRPLRGSRAGRRNRARHGRDGEGVGPVILVASGSHRWPGLLNRRCARLRPRSLTGARLLFDHSLKRAKATSAIGSNPKMNMAVRNLPSLSMV